MNNDQVFGYIRTLCTMAGSILGYSASQTTGLTTAVVGLASFVFFAISLYGTWKANSTKGKIASVAANPDVAKVTMQPTPTGAALANDAALPKVTL